MAINLETREREMPSSADSAPSTSYAVAWFHALLEPAASAAASERATAPRREARLRVRSASPSDESPPSDAPPSDVAPAPPLRSASARYSRLSRRAASFAADLVRVRVRFRVRRGVMCSLYTQGILYSVPPLYNTTLCR